LHQQSIINFHVLTNLTACSLYTDMFSTYYSRTAHFSRLIVNRNVARLQSRCLFAYMIRKVVKNVTIIKFKSIISSYNFELYLLN